MKPQNREQLTDHIVGTLEGFEESLHGLSGDQATRVMKAARDLEHAAFSATVQARVKEAQAR